MPELFRNNGFVFYFYSLEHAPVHVHVRGTEGFAKYTWNGTAFMKEYDEGIKANDLKRIEDSIEENADIIIRRWHELFKDNEQDQENMV